MHRNISWLDVKLKEMRNEEEKEEEKDDDGEPEIDFYKSAVTVGQLWSGEITLGDISLGHFVGRAENPFHISPVDQVTKICKEIFF